MIATGHVPRKRFGQHFLVDRHYIARIVAAIAPARGDKMVEIGPGLGALTEPLLAALDHLHVVEIDRDIVARLAAAHPAARLTIHQGDALAFDFGRLGPDLRVVGNLPYNISTPLLFHLATHAKQVRDMSFMLQREVVERMVAAPSSPDYGRLSVMLQYRFAMQRLFTVPPGAFRPPPKVESAIVHMLPLPAGAPRARNEAVFGALVAAGFGQRRKTLRNTLKAWLSADDFAALGIDAGLRAENLSVADFIALADFAGARESHSDIRE